MNSKEQFVCPQKKAVILNEQQTRNKKRTLQLKSPLFSPKRSNKMKQNILSSMTKNEEKNMKMSKTMVAIKNHLSSDDIAELNDSTKSKCRHIMLTVETKKLSQTKFVCTPSNSAYGLFVISPCLMKIIFFFLL